MPYDVSNGTVIAKRRDFHLAAGRRICFLISLLILFLELACIRWFPAHVLYLTFFTNTVLLACFLGMSVGCLAASRAATVFELDARLAGPWPWPQRAPGRRRLRNRLMPILR